MIAFSIT